MSDFGPSLRGGRARSARRLLPGPGWRRILAGFVAAVLVGLVGAVGSATTLLWYGDSQIDRLDVAGIRPAAAAEAGEENVAAQGPHVDEINDLRNVLLVGSDSRERLSSEEREDLGTGEFEGSRTDTIILVQLDPQREGAAMLSFPRDLLVTLCDGSQGKINSAYEVGESTGAGGPSCLVQTLTDLTGIEINHYAQVDLAGFVQVVDTLGGVRLYLDEPLKDPKANLDVPAGCITLDSAEALGFVRTRTDNDFGRIARQQRFIREVVDQITSARVALDVPRLFSLVDAAASAIDADHSLSLNVMRRLAFSFRNLSSDRIDARTVPGFNRLINDAAYVVIDEARAEPLFAAFREGVAAPAELGTEGPADVEIADVPPVTVLNGTTVAGLAATATGALEASGFTVAVADNAPTQDETRTRVVHPPHRREEAQLLADALGDARVVAGEEGSEFTVILGADADAEALAATVAEASEAPPTAAPEPAPTPTYKGATTPDEGRDC